jgi:hypothetical protein
MAGKSMGSISTNIVQKKWCKIATQSPEKETGHVASGAMTRFYRRNGKLLISGG